MIQVGYFQGFKGAPTVLIAASVDDFCHVYDVFAADFDRSVDVLAELRRINPDTRAVNISRLEFLPHASGTKLHVNGSDVTWSFDDGYRERLKGLVLALRESQLPAHQYLDTGSAATQFIVSKGEYIHPLD
jgi:hypothetical protein